MPEEKNKLQPLDELIERNKIFEGIFIPQAMSRRNKIKPSGNAMFAKFVHYTSAEGALKIIESKRLWMRNATCMSDYSEVQHGFKILRNFFSQKEKAKIFTDVVHSSAPGAAVEAIKLFNKWWESGSILNRTYIASLSEHKPEEDIHGRLSMWRAFGGNTSRVAIVFKVPAQSEGARTLNLNFSPVAYLTKDEAEQFVPEVIKKVTEHHAFLKCSRPEEVKDWVLRMLLWASTCIKHEGFREELEWRVAHCPEFQSSPLIKGEAETYAGIPQVIFKLPLDKRLDQRLEDLDFANIFDHLIIGPTPFSKPMREAYVDALSKCGISDPDTKISASDIPIRS
jgi:hypothetical protein